MIKTNRLNELIKLISKLGSLEMGNIHTVGPNEALIISGSLFNSRCVRVVVGGFGWSTWCVSDVQKLSLNIMTLNPVCEAVLTREGIPVTVTGVAQVKIMKEIQFLACACELLLGKENKEIEVTILNTFEGHLRAILSTLSVEEVYKDRDKFAAILRETASPDLGKMGIEILSFTIKDIYDKVNYLNSLAKIRVALVKRDAEIGVAIAEQEAGIQESECNRIKMVNYFQAEEEVAASKKYFEIQTSRFNQDIQTAKANAELAYTLQECKEKQLLIHEEVRIKIVEKGKSIKIAEQEVECNEKRLTAEIKLSADAEAFKIEQIGSAQKFAIIAENEAEAESIRLRGLAEADVIRVKGLAEAESMVVKAEALKKYGDIAMLNLTLNALPKIAAEVSAPLGKVNEIVRLSSSLNTKRTIRNIS